VNGGGGGYNANGGFPAGGAGINGTSGGDLSPGGLVIVEW
jgi:hypothetical protein